MLIVCHRMMGTRMETRGEIENRGKLLCRKEAARYLTALGLVIAPQTLARKYHEGTGPLCTHVGVRAMYWQAHLDAYFKAQVSEAKPAPAVRRPMRSKTPPALKMDAIAPAPAPPALEARTLAVVEPPVASVAAPSTPPPTKGKKRKDASPPNQQELPF